MLPYLAHVDCIWLAKVKASHVSSLQLDEIVIKGLSKRESKDRCESLIKQLIRKEETEQEKRYKELEKLIPQTVVQTSPGKGPDSRWTPMVD